MKEPGAPSLGVAVMRFLHTLITPTFTYAVLFRNVKDLVSQKDFGPGVSGSIWRMVREAFKTNFWPELEFCPNGGGGGF